MNAILKMNQLGSHACLERGLRKFLRLLFIFLWIWMEKREITVIPAVTAQSLLIAFWTLTCFFFLQGNQMFLHSVTDSLPDCPRTATSLHPPPAPHIFKNSNSLLCPFLYPCLSVCIQINGLVFIGDWSLKIVLSAWLLVLITWTAGSGYLFKNVVTSYPFSPFFRWSVQLNKQHFPVTGQQQRWQVNNMLIISLLMTENLVTPVFMFMFCCEIVSILYRDNLP